MSRKKINLMQVVLSLEMGGSENLVLNLMRKLDKRRFNLSVCCIIKGGVLQKKLKSLNIPLYILNRKEGFDIKLIVKLASILRKENIHVLHTHHLGPLIYGLPAAKIAGVSSVIHTEHSYEHLIESKKYFWITRFLFKGVSKVVGVCDDITTFLKDKVRVKPSKVITIANGIDIERFSKNGNKNVVSKKKEISFDEDNFIIGTVGRLSLVKNHESLLYAFKKVSNVFSNVRLVIVGDGELKDSLGNLAETLAINSKVKLLGTRDDIPELINIMDIFILPSLSEGLSLALLEAMAAKKPIIASNVGGNKNVIQDGVNGLFVSPQNINEISDKIINLYKDSEKRHHIAQAGYCLVKEKYSLLNMIGKYEKLYQGS